MIQLTKEQQDTYLHNEAINYHTENVVFLAKIVWDKDLINEAEDIQFTHEKIGSLPYDIQQKRDKLFNEIWKVINLDF